MQTVFIKNMVCPRCISSVQAIFNSLNITLNTIELGQVTVKNELSEEQKTGLKKQLELQGFELLEDQRSKTIAAIKTIIINQIHHTNSNLSINFSALLSDKLNHEYTSLSKLFSSVEGITIERFIVKQKIEKIKELICYKELTLSEIAFQMNYSSVAHLSSQFKKETGISPSQFKKLNQSSRKPLDKI